MNTYRNFSKDFSSIASVFFLISFLSISFTTIRWGGTPFGVSEFAALIGVLFLGVSFNYRLIFRNKLLFVPVLGLILIGGITAASAWRLQGSAGASMYRDSLAYFYSGLYGFFFAALLSQNSDKAMKTLIAAVRAFIILSFLGVCLFVAQAKFFGADEFLSFFGRYKFLSTNPNQTAFFIVICFAFLLSYLKERITLFLAMLISVAAFNRSDAMTLTMTGLSVLFIVIWFFRKDFGKIKALLSALAFLYVVLFLLGKLFGIVASEMKISDELYTEQAKYGSLATGNGGQKVDDRADIFRTSFTKSQNHFIFGHGSGAVVERGELKQESHNILLDILLQGGIVSLMIFLGLLAVPTIKLLLSGRFAIALLAVAPFIFSQLHFTLRNPAWIIIMIVLYFEAWGARPGSMHTAGTIERK